MSSGIFHDLPFGSVMLDSSTTCDTSIVKSVVCDDYLCVSTLEWKNDNLRRYYITKEKNSSYEYRNLVKHQDKHIIFEDRKNLNTAMCSNARYLYGTSGYLVSKDTSWIQIGDRIIDEFDIHFNKCDDNLCITQVGTPNYLHKQDIIGIDCNITYLCK